MNRHDSERFVPEHVAQRRGDALAHDGVELGPAVPGDRRLERVGDEPEARLDAEPDADERVAPRADRALAAGRRRRPVDDADLVVVDVTAGGPRQRDRFGDVGPLRHLGRLEADDHQRLRAVEPGRPLRLLRVEQAEVRRPQLGLHDLADALASRPPTSRT